MVVWWTYGMNLYIIPDFRVNILSGKKVRKWIQGIYRQFTFLSQSKKLYFTTVKISVQIITFVP
jgi:hypothetical protein